MRKCNMGMVLRVVDNSGAAKVMCIRPIFWLRFCFAVVIKRLRSIRKVQLGESCWAFVIRCRWVLARKCGIYVRGFESVAILIRASRVIGTRVRGVV